MRTMASSATASAIGGEKNRGLSGVSSSSFAAGRTVLWWACQHPVESDDAATATSRSALIESTIALGGWQRGKPRRHSRDKPARRRFLVFRALSRCPRDEWPKQEATHRNRFHRKT